MFERKWELGSDLIVFTQDDQVHTGSLFAVDHSLNIMCLLLPVIPDDYYAKPAPLRPSISYKVVILNLSTIQKIETVNASSDTWKLKQLPTINPQRLQKKMQKSIRVRQQQFGSIAPKGTCEQALAIFAAISKTYITFFLLNFFIDFLAIGMIRKGVKVNPSL